MRDQRRFHLGGAEAMSRDVDHVVDAAGDPPVAVGVAPAAIPGKIVAGIGLEVGIDEALVIAIDRAHLAGPGVDQAEIAGARPL